MADVTDKEIGDGIKKAGVEGEQFKGQLESLKPLAAIQKPHGALGRLAVFKEHPAAALAGSAIGGTVLGSIVPGVGHFMGMYGGALGAGELADRLAAVKALRERGALASAK